MNRITASVCALAAALVAGTPAWAGPQHEFGSPTSRARSTSDYAAAGNCGAGVCTSVSAQVFDDLNGFVLGYFSVTIYDNVNFTAMSVSCSGPEYAKGVSVNAGKGAAVVQITLDPAAIGCFGFNTSEPIVVDLAGRATGLYIASESGERKVQLVQSTARQKVGTDEFDVAFDGMVGNTSGPFLGFARAFRSTDVQKVK